MEKLQTDSRQKLELLTLRRKWAHAKLLKLDSKVYKAVMKVEEATFTDGALSRKQKELIALGISVITNCQSCMQWHIEQAAQAGATPQEVLEALEVAMEMGIGAATVSTRFALEVMDSVYGDQPGAHS